MTNSDNGMRLADELTLTIAQQYGWSGFKQIEKTVVRLPPEVYQPLVDRYQSENGGGNLKITFRDGHLFIRPPAAPIASYRRSPQPGSSIERP